MKTRTLLLMLSLATAACAGRSPHPESANDSTEPNEIAPPEPVQPTMEEPPLPTPEPAPPETPEAP